MLYLVTQIDYSYYRGKSVTTIKWVYDSFNKADELARKLYNHSVGYYNSNWNYDEIKEWLYIERQRASWWWRETVGKYEVIEFEYELNSECEIEI
jgi:hypothetical protein